MVLVKHLSGLSITGTQKKCSNTYYTIVVIKPIINIYQHTTIKQLSYNRVLVEVASNIYK